MSRKGIDLSKWNGPVDKPAEVAAFLKENSGGSPGFAIVNLGSANVYRTQQIESLRAAGVNVEGYFYLYPQNDLGAQLAEAVANRDDCSTVWVDTEITGGLPDSVVAEVTHNALVGINWHLLQSGLYSNDEFLNRMAGSPWGYPLWFAQPGAPRPDHPEAAIWQNSWTTVVPGFPGPIDTNEFLGDEALYDRLFNVTPATPPPPPPDPNPNQGEPTFNLPMRELRFGDSGVEVAALRGILNARGGYDLVSSIQFDVLTERAVRDFQAQNGLSNDGVVGPDTWASLIHG